MNYDLQNDIAFKTIKETDADFYKMLKESSIFEISDFKFIPCSDLHIYVRHPFKKMKLIKNEKRS